MRDDANVITYRYFIDAFARASSEQAQSLLEVWPSQPNFTGYFKSTLMPRVAELLCCDLACERNRIDVVLTRGPGHVIVAVEHENNFGGTALSEVVKLRHSGAALGVLITYVGNSQRQRMLQKYNAAMSIEAGKDAATCSNILVVFGPYGMKRPIVLEWAGYGYDGQEFKAV